MNFREYENRNVQERHQICILLSEKFFIRNRSLIAIYFFIKFFECFAGVMIGREIIFKKIARSGNRLSELHSYSRSERFYS